MKAIVLLLIACMGLQGVNAQQCTLGGHVKDSGGKPLSFATVALLQPSDSTLSYFGITDDDGAFLIKAINKGEYLLQVAVMGYNTFYKQLQLPLPGNSIEDIVLKEKSNVLKEVQVSGEKIPFLLKKDTVEYNAGAYKVKPDATVEDLLKKLPGVEVDKAGNVKANGKDVTKVLVDGKEFFGDDTKVATKNLPSDAISKVQVFDKKSDQSLFTGIDDGERERTVNLLLKNNKKSGYFGDVQAGGGTGDHFKLNGKLYRFTKKTQLAALGMINNINQFGFTFNDYINFRGGLRSLMDGNGSVNLRLNDNMPINFGQPEPGFITSAAAGLNYSYEWSKTNVLNISYLGNGADKKIDEISVTRNFTNNGAFVVDEHNDEQSRDQAHRLNINWRAQPDSSIQVNANANAELNYSRIDRSKLSHSTLNDMVMNDLDSRLNGNGQNLVLGAKLSVVKKSKGEWPVLKLHSDVSYEKGLSSSQWNNLATYLPASPVSDQQHRDNHTEYLAYSAGGAVVRHIGKGYYAEGDVTAGIDRDGLNRVQGVLPEVPVDSLSSNFNRTYKYARPSLALRKSTEDVQFNIGLKSEMGTMQAGLPDRHYQYLLPFAFWQNDYSTGKEINISYNSRVTLPTARQMFPIADRTNPLYIIQGSTTLKPEYLHQLVVNWHNFDQFNFTSLFVNADLRYTANKIAMARNVNPDLTQVATYVNIDGCYTAEGAVEYTTPIRKLGVNTIVGFDENYSRMTAPVNDQPNINNTFTHELSLRFNNSKREKIDAEIGGSAAISTARYSIDKTLDNDYYKYSGTAKISYQPVDYLYFKTEADISYYDALNFSKPVMIPLLNAEISWYFLKAKRGVLTLEAFDLLNKNINIRRISQLNYLQETQSNIIGRYVMLSFKYRLNMLGGNSDKIRIN